MFLPLAIDVTLPLEDPILKFLLILIIILAAPLLLNKLKIPYLLGLIIAGAVIGPHGLNLVLRDSSIILSGTAGLLYIMFLSGLELDMKDFRKNSWRSVVFGLYTFSVPMVFGILAGYYVLGFSIYSSILLAALFASQTLIAYPIVSKLGITRDKAVTIAVGGTVITDTLALLLLTIIVGMATGNVDDTFWYRLSGSVLACIVFIMVVFPPLAHWFFKRCSDSVSQYIFVLVMVFTGAFLAHLAGLEPIIGAFLAGLALNRLIPKTSPLMNRIEFIGNAIFIPFFLIGVGMLIDYRAFFRDWESIKVAIAMIVLITAAKYVAALLTQKTFKLSKDQRTLLFGLSSAHVAATLAAVTVGYNVILGYGADGEPIRLLNESVLNGTILMILATCTVSTFASQRGAHRIAATGMQIDEEPTKSNQILIPIAHEENIPRLVEMGTMLKHPKDRSGLYALNAVDTKVEDPNLEKQSRKLLDMATNSAAAADYYLQGLMRYDVNIVNAIIGVVRENSITDIVMGMHQAPNLEAGSMGNLLSDLLSQLNITAYIYRSKQPMHTIKRHIIVVPEQAELEAGFQQWMERVRTLLRTCGGEVIIYASEATTTHLKTFRTGAEKIEAKYLPFNPWTTFAKLEQDLRPNDCLWLVMSRKEKLSYHQYMSHIPDDLQTHFTKTNCVLIYPVQAGITNMRYL